MQDCDVVVVGGGIVGLAFATAITTRLPGLTLTVIDKEPGVGTHQTAHNSGVLHSGLYYRPGSLKAVLCVKGRDRMAAYCKEERLPMRIGGKLVVATSEDESESLRRLYQRGLANGVPGLRMLRSEEMGEFEPHAAGVAALHVPGTGVVDFGAVARRLAATLPGDLILGSPVISVENTPGRVIVSTGERSVRGKVLVNCAGLHSDRVARISGVDPPVRIVPFRGEYYQLAAAVDHLVQALVYPVPDPRFPFLGVHFTRRIDGSVEIGPNAVLALGREHYRGSPINLGDIFETLRYSGFWRMAGKYWRTGASEMLRSAVRRSYARAARRLVPEIRAEHLKPGGAGVRAQAVARDGTVVDDFSVVATDTAVHVLNAPSPAATASFAIGAHVSNLVEGLLKA